MQQPPVAARGDIVQVHVRAHQAAHALLHRRMERDQVHVPQQYLGNIGRVVVAAAVGRAVAGKVFGAGQQTRGTEFCSLESANLRPRHGRAQIGIFTRTFYNAAPARIASNVHHGSESPLDAGRARIFRSHPLGLFLYRGIPRGSHRQRHRKDSPVAVDYVEADQQGNVQAGAIDGHMLEPVDLLHIHLPQDRPDLSLGDRVIRDLLDRISQRLRQRPG